MAVKLAKKKKVKENTGKLITISFLEYLCAFWAIVLAFAVPLYMKDGYYQIGTAKYNAYAHVVVYGMPVLLVLTVLYIVFSAKEKGITLQGFKNIWADMSVTDRCVLGYLLVVLVSYLFCGQWKEAFWGYNGWYMGLFSQLSFVLIYFIFSRFMKDSTLVLSVLCAVSTYVFVVGILHRLLIDTVGTYTSLTDYYKTRFLSTLGQASWYSSFMTVILPLGMFAFWYFKNYILRAIAGVFLLISFMTMVTQNTDSAYFGFLAATMVLFHVSVKHAKSMRRFFEVMLLFALAPKCMWLLLKKYPNEIMVWDAISELLVFDARIWILSVLCIVMIIVFALLEKKAIYPEKAMRILRTVVYCLLGGLIAFWVVMLVWSANGQLPAALESLANKIPYLRWDKTWGNNRGFTWAFTMQMYADMNIKEKLIGVGPDCYAIYAHGNYTDLLKEQWSGSILTNAHNEWMNMLINTGLFGAVSYLGVFVTALVRFVKNSEEKPVLLGMAACIAAYMAHNLFCYQQVLCTPFVFLFMAIGEYQMRKKEK